jgi:hypothetical protein
LKKYILYGIAACIVLLTVATITVYFYQNEIIKLFVNELNKKLTTKVEVAKIELSLFDKFPHVAVSFNQLKIDGAISEFKQPLATADRLYLTFDFWNIFAGTYKVNEVFLENAQVQIYLDEKGEENYQIFKSTQANTSTQQINFALEKIQLEQVHVLYTDKKNDQVYDIFASKASASLQGKNENLLIALQGQLNSKFIRVGKYKYFADKEVKLESELIYNLEEKHLQIKPSLLEVKRSEFMVEGTFENHSTGLIDLQIKGKDTDVQTVVSLLPAQYSDELGVYKSKGKVYFDSQVKGATFKGAIPEIVVQFGCDNASFYQQNIDRRIENAYLKGSFTNGKKHNRSTSVLTLTHIKGILEGKAFGGNFSMSDFDNPYLAFDVKGDLDAASLFAFYPLKPLSGANGNLVADVKFEGKLTDLRSKAVNQFVRTSGSLNVKDLSFKLKNSVIDFNRINGDFAFNKSDLLVNNLTGRAGNSDFKVNGLFRNIMAYLFFKDQALAIEAEFAAHLLDLDELLTSGGNHSKGTIQKTANGKTGNYQFAISPHLTMDLNCRVDYLKFRKFNANTIQGNLHVYKQVAKSPNIRFHSADGQISASGTVNTSQPERIAVDCMAEFNGLSIDSVFYMFENFDQDFISDKHLRGKVTAQLQTSMIFNSQLDIDASSLVADAQTIISNGGLVDFEPMQKLSRFINQYELANIQFSQMQNNIHIANRTVYIPEMEIRSNVSNISIKGTHTFDQVMDYKLKVPTYNFTKKRAIAVADEEKTSNLFLSIKGTADDYKIAYDKEAVKEKIREDFQEEKKEIKSLFKGKHVPSEQIEPVKKKSTEQKEEYFDW